MDNNKKGVIITPELAKKLLNDRTAYLTKEGREYLQMIVNKDKLH